MPTTAETPTAAGGRDGKRYRQTVTSIGFPNRSSLLSRVANNAIETTGGRFERSPKEISLHLIVGTRVYLIDLIGNFIKITVSEGKGL